MSERIVPAPDAFATCPQEGKILEYYASTFEAIYVQLHPFIKAVSISTQLFCPTTYPGRLVKNCVPSLVAEVASKAGLPSLASVDVGLRTMIRGLKTEFSNQQYADRIESLVDSDKILPPQESCFSDLLHDRTLAAIQSFGYEWVWIGYAFGTERKLHWIEDLKGKDIKATAGHCDVLHLTRSCCGQLTGIAISRFFALLDAIWIRFERTTV